MSKVQHVYRRGHIFWWRRIHQLSDSRTLDVRLSLRTSDRCEARNRGAALTATTGVVVGMLHERIREADARPTEADLQAIARQAYGERLAQFCDEQRQMPDQGLSFSSSNLASADLYQRMLEHGGHLGWSDEEEGLLAEHWGRARIERLKELVGLVDEGQSPISGRFVDGYIRDLGFVPHGGLRRLVMPLMFEAYRDACLDAEAIRVGNEPRSRFAVRPIIHSPRSQEGVFDRAHVEVPPEWRDLTVSQVAERMIAEKPRLSPRRRTGKRARTAVGEQTLRQIRWAARLMEMAMDGRPFWTLTNEDLDRLDEWFERLPVQCGKAPWHRDHGTTLEAICLDAEFKVETGDLSAGDIGLQVGTTNKHFRKLEQLHDFMRKDLAFLPVLKFADLISPDIKDEREAREAYSIEQGRELFSLAPWTGCAGLRDRFTGGSQIIHDSLYFVLLLVWYTGMRREEVCKLLVDDIRHEHRISHISIRFTEAGRLKTASSVRLIAIADEVVRLGFLDYVAAIRAAGHSALFPELVSERANAKKGDTFYKLWWIYIKPLLPSLKRGQAMHAARHMVDTELKDLEVFPEARDDALGHKGKGEGPSRYAKATRLKRLRILVNQIPKVTEHLAAPNTIRVLPESELRPRPMRNADQFGDAMSCSANGIAPSPFDRELG